MSTSPLKLGLIGAGRIGRLHAEHLRTRISGVEVAMVADVSIEAARQCAEQFAIPTITDDYHEMLVRPDIAAVIICSSTDTHALIMREAARAGKHIFCEKPIALNLASVDEALATVASSGVKLQIGFNRRFDANYRRVRQAVTQGDIGQPQLLHIFSYDPAPPPLDYIRLSGGLFLDMTIHDFDMARFLVGSEVEEVYVQAGVLVDAAIGDVGDVDTAVVSLRFTSGTLATISNSRRAVYGYDQRVELLGSQGAISTGNNYPNTATLSTARGIQRDMPLHFFLERYTESFVAEMRAFIDAIQHDTLTAVTGNDGRAPIVMALAARRSLLEHRPVRLNEIE